MTKISNYKFQLKGTLTTAGSSVAISNDLELDAEVVFTDEACVLTNRDRTIIERVRASATGGVLTLLKRGMEQDSETEDAGLKKEWREGTIAYMTILGPQLADVLAYTEFQKGLSGGEFATTAARDTALGGDGAATQAYTGVYVAATGLHYNYNLSTNQWESVDTGTTTPNASTSGAGTVKIPTQTQSDDGDDSDAGVYLSSTPYRTGLSMQKNAWIVGTDAGGDDAYVLTLSPAPTAYEEGMEVLLKATTANTGACTIDVNSLGAKSIKTPGGNDPQDGDIPAGKWKRLRYDGTNFIIVDGHQATTAEIGMPEMATDAEAYAGTDETRYINSKQRTPLVAILHTTRAMNATSGSVNVAHGLGYAPKYITCIAKYGSNGYCSEGFSNGTTHRCTRYSVDKSDNSTSIESLNVSGACIEIVDSDGSGSGNDKVWQTATASFDATNIALSWTKGTAGPVTEPSTEIQITILAIA